MRYNEKELQALSRQPAELAAELGMRGPKKGSVLKRRLVKLVVNFLFYFRTDEAEPVGALLLERCRVTQEEPSGFSISFMEDPERKYHFECCSEEQCQEWMGALRRASYEFMRRSLIFYRNEIQKMTGKTHQAPVTNLPHVTGPRAASLLRALVDRGGSPGRAGTYDSKCTCTSPPRRRESSTRPSSSTTQNGSAQDQGGSDRPTPADRSYAKGADPRPRGQQSGRSRSQ